jgi:hypothetical protein
MSVENMGDPRFTRELEALRKVDGLPEKHPRLEDMDMDDFRVRVRREFSDMTDLLLRKRQSYGTRNLTRHGTIGILVRMSDKIDRLENMASRGELSDAGDGEGAIDAWRDIIGYGVLGLLHARGIMSSGDK